jgi:integrase/recombinase XerD
MTLSALVQEYVTFKQALGLRYRSETRLFRSFLRAVGSDTELDDLAVPRIEAFLRVGGSVTAVWHLRYTILNGLFRYARERGHLRLPAPLPARQPRRVPPRQPHIYTVAELQSLVTATKRLQTQMSPLQALTFRTLLLTLYGTGMRISEALGLKIGDFSLRDSLLTVRDTKFFKSRLIPVGARLAEYLGIYLQMRQSLPRPFGEHSALFATRTGHALTYHRVDKIFRRLRHQASITPGPGTRFSPRLHDIRHTYAVHRLEAWYRQGADVNCLLPKLSTYLGHLGVEETQHYLTMTPGLLDQACGRFERYALPNAVAGGAR